MFKYLKISLILLFLGNATGQEIQIEIPGIILSDVPFDLTFTLKDTHDNLISLDTTVTIQGIPSEALSDVQQIHFSQGQAKLRNIIYNESGVREILIPEYQYTTGLRIIPGWLSLLPPLLAIILALLLRQVLVALFVGVWTGASIVYDFNPFLGFLYSFTDYIGRAPADPEKMSIIIFTLALGGMVGVISKMGGTQGIVEKLSQYASNSRRGQLVTWLMGIFIFFDDYANTLLVGSTMRPLSDRLRISREKLSYLVDSTAAPVANIAIISTWIGFEIGLIGAAYQALGIQDNAYITFLQTIPYNFYPIFALSIGLMIAISGRDFGPMLRAEQRSHQTGAVLSENATPLSSLDASEISASDETPKRWFNGFIPIFVMIISTLAGLWITGLHSYQVPAGGSSDIGFIQYVSLVIGGSDSYAVLMWASFLGGFTAIGLAVGQKILKLDQAVQAWVGGIKAMLLAILILTMAWAIGNICADLKTAEFVVQLTRDIISAHYVPLLSFLSAALISFATGTSWGVMAILMPIVIPIAHILPLSDPSIPAFQQQGIMLSTIASVLAGATFGDHCSPISDTTIMSSMASGADHVDHVRTQLPYALLGGVVSIVIGYLPIGFGLQPWLLLPAGAILIIIFIRFFGKNARL